MKNEKGFLGFFLLLLALLFIYRGIFTQGKIIFPSNFLAQFYSPWSTEKFEGWEAGIPHKPIGTDQIRFFYPAKTFANEMIAKDQVPLWNPFVFSGNPHLADFQSAVFYPLNIFYLILPQLAAWSLLIFIQPLLAAVFTYFYLRFHYLHKLASFFGATAFGLSGFMTVWGQENTVVSQTALWLPLILLGIDGLLKTGRSWYFFLGAFSFAASFLAGHFQITFYLGIFAFIYAIARMRQLKIRSTLKSLMVISAMFVFSLSIAAIQLLPSLEGFLASPRGTSSASYLFKTYLLPVTHFLNGITPDIFGTPASYNFFGRGFYHETVFSLGIIPLIFAVFAFFKFRANPMVRLLTFGALISFFLTIDSPVTRFIFGLPIPLVSAFLPSRILIITTFSLAVLAAFGLSFWLEKEGKSDKKIFNRIFLSFFLIILAVLTYATINFLTYPPSGFLLTLNDYLVRAGGFTRKEHVLVMIRNTLLPLVFLGSTYLLVYLRRSTSKTRPKYIFVVLIIIFSVFNQLYFLNKYLTLGYPQFLYPKHEVFSFLQGKATPDRFLAFGQPILGNISTQERVYSPEGLDPIFSSYYGQLLFAAKNEGRLTADIPRIEATLSEIGRDETMTDNPRRLKLLSLLGVKYLLYYDGKSSPVPLEKRFPQDLFLPVWRSGNWLAFEYQDAFPRAFLASNFVLEKDPQNTLDKLFDLDFDLSKEVILKETPPNFKPDLSTGNNVVEIKKYEPHEIKIEVKNENPGLLFLSDNYYPGWQAFTDGSPTKIYRADYAFRAIAVEKGQHTVSFVYNPFPFAAGKMISLGSLGILLALSVYLFFRTKVVR